ncbi:hypothetical protein THASP1DRAFT_32674 [Thamnocephalis sphaerospora]|uniref:Uncharacterized protein n=1 Tax=Thamnocephalis sphaerospora TaxID=78915 RepID=A0A4V1IVW6_9FUNG|nr:hypothetical protein THASP1DRAFT_32674 [Thamnocephalis sphaerospora]|eukprot:RKP05489.1 hypothetical protein THASP1DRAFT_32674 [Thamnocephalis sphaerospora]
MRFISLSGATATVALASLALVGSLASAASVPSQGRVATAEDLAALKQHLGDYFQLQPRPALAKPKDSTPIYQREKSGNFFAVELYTPGGYLQRELTVMTTTKLGGIRHVEIADYNEGSRSDKLNNSLDVEYDESEKQAVSYKLKTQKGTMSATVQKNADNTNDLNVTLQPGGKTFTLKNVPLWDGKTPLFSNGKA